MCGWAYSCNPCNIGGWWEGGDAHSSPSAELLIETVVCTQNEKGTVLKQESLPFLDALLSQIVHLLPVAVEEPGLLAVPCVPRNSKSGHQLIQNNKGGMLSLSPG